MHASVKYNKTLKESRKNSNLKTKIKRNNTHEKSVKGHTEFKTGASFPKDTSLMPRQIESAPIQQVVRRYVAANAVAGNYSILDMLASQLVAISSTLAISLVDVIRLTRVRIWAPLTTQGTSATVTLKPIGTDSTNNSFNDLEVKCTDTTVSIDRPAYIDYCPPTDSPSGSWHKSINVDLALIEIACPKGTVMDLHFQYIMNTDDSPNGFNVTVAGATLGVLYVRNVLTNFQAVGVNIIG